MDVNTFLIIQLETHDGLQCEVSLGQRNTQSLTLPDPQGTLTLQSRTLKTESLSLPLQKLISNMSFHFCLFPTSSFACPTVMSYPYPSCLYTHTFPSLTHKYPTDAYILFYGIVFQDIFKNWRDGGAESVLLGEEGISGIEKTSKCSSFNLFFR